MQSLGAVTYANLSGPVQTTLKKFEIYDGADWKSLCDLESWDSHLFGWPYRKLIALPVPTANLTDFPVCIKIVADAAIGAKARADGHDIRFAAADGVTELPYERDEWAGGGGDPVTAIFWVKSDVSTAGTYIWLYYGNAGAADGDDHEAVWDANYKLVAHMNDLTTSTIHDSTSNHNDGTKKGANEPIEADGKIAKGQDFDGTDDFIGLGSPASLALAKFTIEAWINPDNLNGWNIIYGLANLPKLYIITGGHLYLYDPGEFPVVVPAGEWTHVIVTSDVADRARFYYNGAFLGSIATVAFSTVASVVKIGQDPGGATQCFPGFIDEVRISSVARSAEWIAYEYANMNPADGGLTWGPEEYRAWVA